jgi:hypothetical protein
MAYWILLQQLSLPQVGVVPLQFGCASSLAKNGLSRDPRWMGGARTPAPANGGHGRAAARVVCC